MLKQFAILDLQKCAYWNGYFNAFICLSDVLNFFERHIHKPLSRHYFTILYGDNFGVIVALKRQNEMIKQSMLRTILFWRLLHCSR